MKYICFLLISIVFVSTGSGILTIVNCLLYLANKLLLWCWAKGCIDQIGVLFMDMAIVRTIRTFITFVAIAWYLFAGAYVMRYLYCFSRIFLE